MRTCPSSSVPGQHVGARRRNRDRASGNRNAVGRLRSGEIDLHRTRIITVFILVLKCEIFFHDRPHDAAVAPPVPLCASEALSLSAAVSTTPADALLAAAVSACCAAHPASSVISSPRAEDPSFLLLHIFTVPFTPFSVRMDLPCRQSCSAGASGRPQRTSRLPLRQRSASRKSFSRPASRRRTR